LAAIAFGLGSRAEATGWVIVITAIAKPATRGRRGVDEGSNSQRGRLILATSTHYTHTLFLYGVLSLIALSLSQRKREFEC
jgi:hypothetical protein